MNFPPFLLGATVLFWGFQTGIFLFSVPMAIAVELPHWTKRRWELDDSDFRRSFELSILLTGGAAIYSLLTRDSVNGIMQLLRMGDVFDRGFNEPDAFSAYLMLWAPLLTLPIILAQVYSVKGISPLKALASYLRIGRRKAPVEVKAEFDLRFIYLGLCVLSAGVTNIRDEWFYTGVCVIATWALWPFRSRRFSTLTWACLMVSTVVLGYGTHIGLNKFQEVVEVGVVQWITGMTRADVDTEESRTAIGKIGELKLSGKIVLRVQPENGEVPELLREASYNVYRGGIWRAYNSETDEVSPENGDFVNWDFAAGEAAGNAERSVLISRSLKRGEGTLSLPNGTARLEQLPVLEMEASNFGVVKVVDGPGLVRYRSIFKEGSVLDSPPLMDGADEERLDFQKPPELISALEKVASAVDGSASTGEKINFLKNYFEQNFTSASYLEGSENGINPITHFLETSHSGHCEYFATATVLLLRQMGVPARYAVGYSVQEYDEKRDRYLVRERHGHAWTLFWDAEGSAWFDLDTTPGSWLEVEEQHASMFEGFKDWLSELGYSFGKLRWLNQDGSFQRYVFIGLGLTMAFAFWRIMRNRKKSKSVRTGNGLLDSALQGADSEFYQIENFLIDQGHLRRPHESLTDWLSRLNESTDIDIDPLQSILRLHYRYRFDSQTVSPAERNLLSELAEHWLDKVFSKPQR